MRNLASLPATPTIFFYILTVFIYAHCVYDAMMLQVHDQMMIDMFLRHLLPLLLFFGSIAIFLSSRICKVNFLGSIRTKREMSRTRDSATPSPEHGPIFKEPEPEHITKEQFNDELDKGLAEMLTQDQSNEEEGEEGRVGEAARGDDEEEDDDDKDDDDEDSEEAYESPKDPFSCQVRRKLIEELDKDFDLNEEVGIKP